ncbi:M23 family metallopeptidase [Bartonella sp. DGB1]|uniref:M23 family metallopeptidase n=1 Tax=Bartonella sp. DGB1 TaxID=3239807 RepID=UPI0035262D4C
MEQTTSLSRWAGGIVVAGGIALILTFLGFYTIFNSNPVNNIYYSISKNISTANTKKNAQAVKENRILQPSAINSGIFTKRDFAPLSPSKTINSQLLPQPFQLLTLNLSTPVQTQYDYPKYDANKIFRRNSLTIESENSTKEYENIDQNITLNLHSIDKSLLSIANSYSYTNESIINEITETVFSNENKTPLVDNLLNVRIVPENVSLAASQLTATRNSYKSYNIFQSILRPQSITNILQQQKIALSAAQITQIEALLLKTTKSKLIQSDTIVQIIVESFNEKTKTLAKISLYKNKVNQINIALNKDGNFILAKPHTITPLLKHELNKAHLLSSKHNQKTEKINLYDSIYQHALASGLSVTAITPIIEALAKRIDLKRTVQPNEQLKLFYQIPKSWQETQKQKKTNISLLDTNILYFSAKFGSENLSYYRYRLPDGKVDYYDQYSKAIGLSILRKPVENARFSSPFGMRRHPVLGYVRLHTGVDWAAPRGTPIWPLVMELLLE